MPVLPGRPPVGQRRPRCLASWSIRGRLPPWLWHVSKNCSATYSDPTNRGRAPLCSTEPANLPFTRKSAHIIRWAGVRRLERRDNMTGGQETCAGRSVRIVTAPTESDLGTIVPTDRDDVGDRMSVAWGLARAIAHAAPDPIAGSTDQLWPALRAAGAHWVVDLVACRPGRPSLVARLGPDRWVVGLPGTRSGVRGSPDCARSAADRVGGATPSRASASAGDWYGPPRQRGGHLVGSGGVGATGHRSLVHTGRRFCVARHSVMGSRPCPRIGGRTGPPGRPDQLTGSRHFHHPGRTGAIS